MKIPLDHLSIFLSHSSTVIAKWRTAQHECESTRDFPLEIRA